MRAAAPPSAAKVFWVGRHPTARDPEGAALFSPLSRVTPAVLRWLCAEHGWREVKPDEAARQGWVPAFSFIARKGGKYCSLPSDAAAAPVVAQFPIKSTAHLDCKLALWRHLVDAGHDACMPPSLAGAQLLDAALAQEWRARSFTPARHSGLLFVKHCRGVKGKAVHVFDDVAGAQEWLRALDAPARESFVCQMGVRPLLLPGTRRAFTLRMHMLWTFGPGGRTEAVHLHKDCIAVAHGADHCLPSSPRAAHVSSAGKASPAPSLLAASAPELYAGVWPQALAAVRRVHACVRDHVAAEVFGEGGAARNVHPYYLFGCDFAVDATGELVLLEINANPAIASGTMQHVPRGIYDTLLQDMIRVAVLPVIDGADPRAGGFVLAYAAPPSS